MFTSCRCNCGYFLLIWNILKKIMKSLKKQHDFLILCGWYETLYNYLVRLEPTLIPISG